MQIKDMMWGVNRCDRNKVASCEEYCNLEETMKYVVGEFQCDESKLAYYGEYFM